MASFGVYTVLLLKVRKSMKKLNVRAVQWGVVIALLI